MFCICVYRFLRGLEELNIPKPVRAELGGGKKEFALAEISKFSQVLFSKCMNHYNIVYK